MRHRASGALLLGTTLLLGACTLPWRREVTPPPTPPEPATPVEPVVPRAELLWDTYGVPHIFAQDHTALLRAYGWSQMRAHAELVLQLYGQARGRAAEYWGPGFLASDVWVHTNGIPARAEQWLAAQNPMARSFLEAFVEGMNAYAEQHADSIPGTYRAVLPVSATDVLAHVQRVLHFTFLTSDGVAGAAQMAVQGGSNGWAIAPARSASGRAMLLANPHVPWADRFTWFEAQLSAPDFDVYGATLVGFPLPGIAFNDDIAWTFTLNTMDAADLYRLTTQGDEYLWNGEFRPFEVREQVLRVQQPDGTLAEQRVTLKRSVHGPVIAEGEGAAVALRVAGLDAPHLLEQLFDMLRAHDRLAFESALSRQQLPLFTVLYADRAGEILHVFNGRVPVRPFGAWSDWTGMVTGETDSTMWTDTHPYHELPRVVNPSSGWLQNANDPPWTTTIPFPLEPGRFPRYIAPAPHMSFRAQQSARMLAEDDRITFAELEAYKHSTRVEAADHMLEDLIVAARRSGDVEAIEAAAVLEAWDRTTAAAARGAVLFAEFYGDLERQPWAGGSPLEIPWTARAPLASPDGLAEPARAVVTLAAAARRVRARHGSLDVAWGAVYRLQRDGLDLPASGGHDQLGVFRTFTFGPIAGDTARQRVTGGDSYVAIIEFADTVRARALLGYGNWSRPGSPHRSDQLPLLARQELRPVWRSRAEILEHLEAREVF